LNIVAYDPFVEEEEAKRLNVTLCSLEELFEQSDVVSLHTPLLPSTRGMITGKHFQLMKQGGTFMNTARGAIVRERDIVYWSL